MTADNQPALQDRVALVTGASRGIGRDAALGLAADGAHVIVNYCASEAAAQEVCECIRRQGRRALAIRADVSIAAEVRALVDRATQQLGPISILVNNAGIARQQTIEEATEQDWDAVVDTNLKSVFLVTQAVLPAMRRAGFGRVINLSSVAAHIGGVVAPHYAASKAGILGLTRFYASRLAAEGITVNAIAPALIETDMVAGLGVDPARIPVGRFGRVGEVTEAVVMLARNGYITGQTINVDGDMYPT